MNEFLSKGLLQVILIEFGKIGLGKQIFKNEATVVLLWIVNRRVGCGQNSIKTNSFKIKIKGCIFFSLFDVAVVVTAVVAVASFLSKRLEIYFIVFRVG